MMKEEITRLIDRGKKGVRKVEVLSVNSCVCCTIDFVSFCRSTRSVSDGSVSFNKRRKPNAVF